MRGTSDQQIESLVVLSPEDLVPQEHPIRRIKPLADRVLQELSPTFSRMYAKGGRPSVPPEHLLKASLLIALYSVRSERQFCERLTHEVTGRFYGAVVSEARRQRLLSEEHFSVDGTLLEAWASLKSVRPRDEERDPPAGAGGRNPWKGFRGERRSNATHTSTTDPEALLARKGQPGARDRARILAADGDPMVLWYVRDALSRAGYAPVVTTDPDEALRIVESDRPRLVLLDLMLPGSDGIELMKSILEMVEVSVIFLSAYGRNEIIARAFEAGAADYMV